MTTDLDLMASALSDTARSLSASDQPFAVATIIRTAGATAAKPGAKALIGADGSILEGWLGGGCTRGAVRQAALMAFATGTPQFVSIAPEEQLADQGLRPGDTVEGTRFARNGCPSKGTIDVFVDPYVPTPVLAVIGSSPVAKALRASAPHFQWQVVDDIPQATERPCYVVIATQGQGDVQALTDALTAQPTHVAFVGSGRKFAALSQKLAAQGIAPRAIASVQSPAGLDIGAVTPEEIALSILADLVRVRRAAKVGGAADA